MVLVSCFGLRFVIDCYDFLVLCLVLGWGLFPSRRDCPTLTQSTISKMFGIFHLSSQDIRSCSNFLDTISLSAI